MRKISYVAAFIAVAVTLILNITSARRSDWFTVNAPVIFDNIFAKVALRYGLFSVCQREIFEGYPGDDGLPRTVYTDYVCRPFPARVKDGCERDNQGFCTAWISAGYVNELGVGFGAMALISILIGVSTHSRRRRIWRAVTGLVALHGVCQIATFALVTEMYRTSAFPTFEDARPGGAYFCSLVSWIGAILISGAVVITGMAAERGHRWAAGNRAYEPITDQ